MEDSSIEAGGEWLRLQGRSWVMARVLFGSWKPEIFLLAQGRDLWTCVDSGSRWLMGKTPPDRVLQLLENRLSLRQLLEEASWKLVVEPGAPSRRVVHDGKTWGRFRGLLPDVDSRLDPDPGEFEEDLEWLRTRWLHGLEKKGGLDL